ncbi:50S ribosomal protein L10 [Metamycoplasma equirhinis]|uniref:Large ribosomal subunit protein uL10 n=1 Tax=Metamycoplasma equirhinis TaxID=92402 RepID=A0ABZ0PBH6_9BACT|nr:50S ribosomal protein L10 [Metamycoplasma equirhinis]TPD98198.1 50S ribosomal protein L10 [Metamycoplasma equirhinis]WPB54210.1 50S ribosomal protein L10 [Metamycoplasma equirhinis]BDX52654.1 50S ribosomal protein L10 [Metamycoplasma equirhinis]
MSALRDAKVLVVDEIAKNITESKALYVVNYKTLDVASLQSIRNDLAKQGVLLKVYKNRLVKQSLNKLNHADLNDYLLGQNIYAFAKEDDLTTLKALVKFKKQFPAFELIAGIYENKVVDAKALNEIAKLPSYEESLMILGNSLLSPIRNLAIGLNELVKQGKVSE